MYVIATVLLYMAIYCGGKAWIVYWSRGNKYFYLNNASHQHCWNKPLPKKRAKQMCTILSHEACDNHNHNRHDIFSSYRLSFNSVVSADRLSAAQCSALYVCIKEVHYWKSDYITGTGQARGYKNLPNSCILKILKILKTTKCLGKSNYTQSSLWLPLSSHNSF